MYWLKIVTRSPPTRCCDWINLSSERIFVDVKQRVIVSVCNMLKASVHVASIKRRKSYVKVVFTLKMCSFAKKTHRFIIKSLIDDREESFG